MTRTYIIMIRTYIISIVFLSFILIHIYNNIINKNIIEGAVGNTSSGSDAQYKVILSSDPLEALRARAEANSQNIAYLKTQIDVVQDLKAQVKKNTETSEANTIAIAALNNNLTNIGTNATGINPQSANSVPKVSGLGD